MAHRLSSSLRRVDHIIKNRLFTGNSSMFVQNPSFDWHLQAQPKSIEATQFLTQSSVHLSNKRKEFDKFSVLKEGNKGGTNIEEKAAADENKDMKVTNNGLSTPPPNSASEAPNEGPQSQLFLSPGDIARQGHRNGGGRDNENSSGGPHSGGKSRWPIWVTIGIFGVGWVNLKKNNEDFNEVLTKDFNEDLNEDVNGKGFVDNFKSRGTMDQAQMKRNDVATKNSNDGMGINNNNNKESNSVGGMIPFFIILGIGLYGNLQKSFGSKIPAKELRLLKFCYAFSIVWAAYNVQCAYKSGSKLRAWS